MKKILPSGHAVVEFALTFPALILLAVILFEVGFMALKQFVVEDRAIRQAKTALAQLSPINTRPQTHPHRAVKTVQRAQVLLRQEYKGVVLKAQSDDIRIAW